MVHLVEEPVEQVHVELLAVVTEVLGDLHRREHDAAEAHWNEHQQRNGNPWRVLMNMGSHFGLGLACEGHEPHARHVEAGHAGGDEHEEGRQQEAWVMLHGHAPGVGDDAFLGPEATDERQADDRSRPHQHGRGRDGQTGGKPTHVGHGLRVEIVVVVVVAVTVLLVMMVVVVHVMVSMMHLVDDRTAGHEQHALGHGVVEQMEERGTEGNDDDGLVLVVPGIRRVVPIEGVGEEQSSTKPGKDVGQLAHR